MAILGYARVSTRDQSTDIQKADLLALGCEKIFFENQSGTTTNNRDQLQAMLNYAREGDTITVMKLDRLARNTIDALTIIQGLTEKKVSIKIMDIGGGIDLTSDMGLLLVTVIASVAQLERGRIIERTTAGRKAAMEKGVKFGRKRTGKQKEVLALKAGGMGASEIAKTLEIGRNTVYRYLKEAA